MLGFQLWNSLSLSRILSAMLLCKKKKEDEHTNI
uniref:Uncharacterized protein n=1 Tax=Arundo donax TaxID=35708 RepID=A0A0A8Z9W2_ARUDO